MIPEFTLVKLKEVLKILNLLKELIFHTHVFSKTH